MESEEEKLARLQEEFTAAQAAYQTEQAAFEEYQQKIEEGTEKAVELNRRFAKWYYVIPGESYDKLSLDRDNIVEPKQDNRATQHLIRKHQLRAKRILHQWKSQMIQAQALSRKALSRKALSRKPQNLKGTEESRGILSSENGG